MKYFLIAGEASGDLHASNLMSALKDKDPNADFQFFGGDLMLAQGGVILKHYRELAYMGFIPVLLNLRTILRNMKMCEKAILEYQPDVLILIDYPGFNLKIAKYIKTHSSIPVYYYISPKVWAWKEYRVKSFKKYVDEMLCILPFEVDFFKKHNYTVNYVGNPTVDAVSAYNTKTKDDTFDLFLKENQLYNKPIIGILAGSRKQEIKDNLPSMIKAAQPFSGYQLIIAGAPGIDPKYYEQFIASKDCKIVFDQTYRLLKFSEVALVTSGTATLETSLFLTPQVVCYKTPIPLVTYWAFKNILHTPYISLVNLIANKEVVKELFASFFSIKNIQEELQKLIRNSEYRANMLENYQSVVSILGKPGASEKAAEVIIKKIKK